MAAITRAYGGIRMTNLENITQPHIMPELIFDYSVKDVQWCNGDCESPFDADKEDCLKCINKWLESEVSHE